MKLIMSLFFEIKKNQSYAANYYNSKLCFIINMFPHKRPDLYASKKEKSILFLLNVYILI